MSRFTLDDLSPEHREQATAQLKPEPVSLYEIERRWNRRNYPKGPSDQAQPRKYRNEPVEFEGRTFDSRWELQRYKELRNQVDAGLIVDLYLQVPFSLEVWTPKGPVRVAAYIADATYRRDGSLVVEDAKSAATRKNPVYALKRKMFEAQYGIAITEVQRQRRKRKS